MIRRLSPSIRQQIDNTLHRAGLRDGLQVRTGRAAGVTKKDGFSWILTTEQRVTVWDWDRYDFVQEVLLADGMQAPGQVGLLDSHARYSVDDLLGSVSGFERTSVDGYEAWSGIVYFAADEKSQRTRQKAADGHLTDGSVGYQVNDAIWVPDGEKVIIAGRTYQGPVKVATLWGLKEFSATPIGADTLAKKVRAIVNGQAV